MILERYMLFEQLFLEQAETIKIIKEREIDRDVSRNGSFATNETKFVSLRDTYTHF